MTVPTPRGRDLLTVARSLAPTIAATADQAEREREMPRPLFERLADHGFYRLLIPESLGGFELDLPSYLLVLEAIARCDGSTAWCLSQANGFSMIAAYLDPAVARAIYTEDPRTYVANGQGPARATETTGGYQVSGRWSFSSGYRHATWLSGICPVFHGEQQRRLPNGSGETREMLFTTSKAAVADVWNVAGLRGTGSQQFAVDGLLVPSDYTVSLVTDKPREPGPLYCFPRISAFASGFAMVALGVARSALETLLEMAGSKVARGAPAPMRDQPMVQADVARAEARIGSGRAFLRETVAEVWDAVVDSGAITLDQRVRIRLAATYAIHQAAEAVDLAYAMAGSSAIYPTCPIQRHFQDIHVITQHIQGRQAHYESVGRFILGHEPDYQWV